MIAGKAPGVDDITVELLKANITTSVDILLRYGSVGLLL